MSRVVVRLGGDRSSSFDSDVKGEEGEEDDDDEAKGEEDSGEEREDLVER